MTSRTERLFSKYGTGSQSVGSVSDHDRQATGVDPAPEGAFDEWRAEVLRRLYALFPDWKSEEDDDGYRTLWAPGYLWQIEFGSDSITLVWRSIANDSDASEDASVPAVFDGLRTILHWPDEYGSYRDLDDPDDRPTLPG